MGTTVPWLEGDRPSRQQFIGASETPAIAGLSPWKSALSVYADKVYGSLFEEDEHVYEAGRALEHGLIEHALERLGIDRKPYYQVFGMASEHAGATLDAYTGDSIIEAKYVGPAYVDHWGPDGSRQIPPYVMLQIAQQIKAVKADRAVVCAAIHGYRLDIRMYEFEAKELEKLGSKAIDIAERFWKEHVAPRVPPPADQKTPVKLLKRLPRKDAIMPSVKAGELYQKLLEAREARKAAEAECEKIEREIIAEFGDGIGAWISAGKAVVLSEERSGTRVNMKVLREIVDVDSVPGLIEPTTRRVLRLKRF